MEKFMNKNLKRFIIVSTPFGIFLIVAFLWLQVAKPAVIGFIKSQIPQVNVRQDVVLVQVGDVDISLLKLQLITKDIDIEFLDKEANIKPVHIEEARAQLDIFNLMVGQLNVSKVTIVGAQLDLELKESKSDEPAKIPVDQIFSSVGKVPVDHIILENTDLTLHYGAHLSRQASAKLGKVSLSNLKSELWLLANDLTVDITDEDNSTIHAEVDLDAVASHDQLNLRDLKMKLLDSVVQAEGKFSGYSDILISPHGDLKFSADLNLQDARNLALKFFPRKNRVPAVSGVVSTQGHVEINSLDDINGEVSVNTSQVVVDHFKLGQAELKTTISKNQILVNEINLEHSAGNVKLKNFKIEQKPPYRFHSRVEIGSFDLHKMFQSIDQGQIPAGLNANGDAQCDGVLDPALTVTCSATMNLRDIWVKSHNNDQKNIVKLKEAEVSGETKFTKEELTYKASIKVGRNSTGSSTGGVKFREGFNFQYESPNLDFDDVEDLAGLNLKGNVKIVGSAYGDSDHGVINATLSATNAEIDRFRLGSLRSTLGYKEGHLVFSNLSVLTGKSNMSGNLQLDFTKDTMQAEVTSPDIHGEDIMFILNKRFNLPFELTGTGKAHAVLQGPLNFWKLSYNLNASLSQGSIAGERFEKLNADLEANWSRILFKNVTLKKTKSVFAATGQINTSASEPVFELKLKADPLQLEESDHLVKYAPSIAGIGYSDGTVTGPVDSPTLLANVTLKQITYDKVEYPNSQGQLKIDRRFFTFNGQFFGRQIQTDLSWPWEDTDGFFARVLVRDLNPLFLLPLISIPQPGTDFYSRLNGEMDISSKTKSLANADGYIRLTDFLLQRGNQSLRLMRPSSLIFKSGLSQMEDIELRGDDTYLKVKMEKTSGSRVKLNISSDLQLRMFHFLVPFAQTLSGNLVVDSQVVFRDSGFELLGDGEITDGAISMKGFPQPIENINAPIEFSKSKIILSDITAQLGPSDISGLGTIDLLGPKNIQVNLKAIADNVQLTFPEKIFTQGKADILFSGSWIPYNLKIDYKVSQGLVENDFEPDPKQNLSLKASSFLPPQQAQLLSPSLAIDANIDMTNGILIKNKILEGEARGALQLQGSPEQPILTGKINIQPGSKLIFKDKPFEIQTATVQFQGTKDINPDIYISASARVSDYDISLLVQGLAKNLTITPTSQPPLSQNDIFTLLALGVTNQANQSLSSDTQQKQTGLEVLAALSNQSQLNKKIQERLGLTVQLAPSVDSTKNIAVPKVVVSKKLSKKVNASYSKPFTGNDQNQEVKLQYLYNNNVSFQLNYQNKDTSQQEQIINSTNTNKSILGLDVEFRDEFK
jgi:translocation and assembly module TamB